MWITKPIVLIALLTILSDVKAAPVTHANHQDISARRDSKTETDNTTIKPHHGQSHKPNHASNEQQANHDKATTTTQIIRGVNIGGWLVLEPWMTPDVVAGTSAVDQWTFDSTSGAAAKLQTHWSTYFTQSDVQTIASWGLNAIRIPIGYWAYDNAGTSYIQGADDYLQRATGWARAAGLKVMIDFHGLPGSQNGAISSGHQGAEQWQSGSNLQRSISALTTVGKKYGSAAYADVVYAIELVNEPDPAGANNFLVTQHWAQQAFAAIRSVATNPQLQVVMHDAFMGPVAWEGVGTALNRGASRNNAPFALDVHLYQNQGPSDGALSWAQHIATACAWATSAFLPSGVNIPVYAGEFSAEIDICTFANGTTFAGTSCSASGCQCSASTAIADWTQPLVQATRMFVEAQLQAFESASNGWFMWSYKGPNAWSMVNAVQYGLIGSPVTQRQYPTICAAP